MQDTVVSNQSPVIDPGSVRLAAYTPKQQYMLGWLACDGHLGKRVNYVRLQLQERDLSVLLLFVETFGARIGDTVRVLNGFRYRCANVSSVAFCSALLAFFRGRLKKDKQFPADATLEFVLGCLDADGAFCVSRDRITMEFRHESKSFADALRMWLEVQGVNCRQRPDRPVFYLERRACRALLALYRQVPFALQRKRAKLERTLLFTSRWWTAAEVVQLRGMLNKPIAELALHFNVTPKAMQLKRWKVIHGYNRRESVPAS
jgi:hypothetical protein